ncbi:MAG: hypothetical protein GY771_08250, partial [bacterium]|nr:hypothetical protein [bacterium]
MARFLSTIPDISPGSAGSWELIDLSAHLVPFDHIAILRVINTSIYGKGIAVRKPSTSFNYYYNMAAYVQATFFCGIHDNEIEIKIGNTSQQSVHLIGLLDSHEAYWYDNPLLKTTGVSNQWTDIVCTEVPAGTKFVLLEVRSSNDTRDIG